MKTTRSLLLATTLCLAGTLAHAGPVLIVNGAIGTNEPLTTSRVTSNLKTLHEAVGNVVTVSSDIPLDLTPYKQVWDLRFNNVFALTGAQQSQYLGFMQGGGGMFVMGEHTFFMARNNSIFSLIGLAGGGSVDAGGLVGNCTDTQNVNAPFTGPNLVTSVNFPCSGIVSSPGTGQWITELADGSGGSAIAWGVGDLLNASAGALTTVLDVNFLENTHGEALQNLAKNLIGFVGDQVDSPNNVPEPTTAALLGLGMLGAVLVRRRAKVQQPEPLESVH